MLNLIMAAGALFGTVNADLLPAQTKHHTTRTTQQRGIASYYSDYYNGRSTASGRAFSNSSNQCAHKTLPFGTRVRVTNRHTGKSTICIVTDRGPFVDGRIIDLSKASFREIAPLSQGLVDVTITVL